MPTSSSKHSQNSGNKASQRVNKLFGSLFIVVIIGAILTLCTKGLIARYEKHSLKMERESARVLCKKWAKDVLYTARTNPPEIGTYHSILTVTDPWGNALKSQLKVSELQNVAIVSSMGKDYASDDDDISVEEVDVHVRKLIAKEIEDGARSAGKGLTSGVMEGLGDVKNSIMNKLRKDKDEPTTDDAGQGSTVVEPKQEPDGKEEGDGT